jgi:DNA-directed RNA polymerase specialized sigma24 family protein
MQLQFSDRPCAQLSHQELIRSLATDPQDRPVVQEFLSRYDGLIRQTAARAINKSAVAVYREAGQLMIDDAVNETYCRLFQGDCRRLRAFRSRYENSIYAYLQTICTNVVRNQVRDDWRRNGPGKMRSLDEMEQLLGAWPGDAPSASAFAIRESDDGERRILEQKILAALRRAFRDANVYRNFIIFKLHFLYGYHCHEIARIKALGLGVSGVGNTVDRIRQWLRREFAEWRRTRSQKRQRANVPKKAKSQCAKKKNKENDDLNRRNNCYR